MFLKQLVHKTILLSMAFPLALFAQVNPNGQIDDIMEMSTPVAEDFVMPDGTVLRTDIYLPITRDSLVVPVNIDIPDFLQGVFGSSLNYDFEVLPNNHQYIVYDSIFDCSAVQMIKNPNPYKLPMVFSRTPYNKGSENLEGAVIGILGYAYGVQDQRGRYTSEGVYLPLISDSWNKNAYHPEYDHALDKVPFDDPRNSNRHEDGYNAIEYIRHQLTRQYDLDGDGIPETEDLLYNGRIAMFGASALGYNQYQAAAAHRIHSDEPGLKAIFPIVAPADFYRSTAFQNGVFRHRLVNGWLQGQIFSGVNDDLNEIDDDPHNDLHSSADYDLPQTLMVNGIPRTYEMNKNDVAELAIDHFVALRYPDSDIGLHPAGLYPNATGRREMDASRAMVDAMGESVSRGKIVDGVVVDVPDDDPDGIPGMGSTPRPGLTHSRYSNMEVPAYHLTGWYDIFIDGQIETWAQMRQHLNPAQTNQQLQKLVIGPWAHQTIGNVTTGDRNYPDNVSELIGLNFSDLSDDNLPVAAALQSEILSWFRYNLNYRCDGNGFEYGEPGFMIPRSQNPTVIASADIPFAGTAYLYLRVPADTVRLSFEDMLAVLGGNQPLSNVSAELSWEVPLLGNGSEFISLPDIPLGALIPGVEPGTTGIPFRDFLNEEEVANVRFYVIGPNDDDSFSNNTLGSYWMSADTFPLPEATTADPVHRRTLYLRGNGDLSYHQPESDEGFHAYVHDPNDPVRSIGGANMIVKTPDGLRDSQGQFELSDPLYAPHTLTHPGVIQFETEPIEEDSLCVIGFPQARLWARSTVEGMDEGPTDTDFFVRIVDVYPDGREYFVVEGSVSARARDYAAALADDISADFTYPFDIDNIPFTNIELGEVYEYYFNLLPIAYTFGHGHKMKVLISSSNYMRYKVNPNLPIEDGEFFRWKPGDETTYTFNGEEMSPRVALNSIHFSDEQPSHITIPVYGPELIITSDERPDVTGTQVVLYPNPARGIATISTGNYRDYALRVLNVGGVEVSQTPQFREMTTIDLQGLPAGLYFVEIRDLESEERVIKRLVKM